MSNFLSAAVSAAETAIDAAAGNTAATAAAISSLTSAINSNSALKQTVQAQVNALQTALMTSNALGIGLALNSLNSLRPQLPAEIGPQLDLLSMPAIQANAVAWGQAIAAINTSMVHM